MIEYHICYLRLPRELRATRYAMRLPRDVRPTMNLGNSNLYEFELNNPTTCSCAHRPRMPYRQLPTLVQQAPISLSPATSCAIHEVCIGTCRRCVLCLNIRIKFYPSAPHSPLESPLESCNWVHGFQEEIWGSHITFSVTPPSTHPKFHSVTIHYILTNFIKSSLKIYT